MNDTHIASLAIGQTQLRIDLALLSQQISALCGIQTVLTSWQDKEVLEGVLNLLGDLEHHLQSQTTGDLSL